MSYTSGLIATAARHVQRDDRNGIPENTKSAYGPKAKEYIQFCNSIFGSLDYPQTVTEEKVYGFLFYQAYRKRRKGGRKKRGEETDQLFFLEDYHNVMAKYNSQDLSHTETLLELDIDPVGYDIVNQYLCAILKLLQHQRSHNANNLTKEHIRSERVCQLLRVVQKRKKKLKKMQFDEKIDHVLSPYMNVKNIKCTEEFSFNKHASKPTYHFASLRDRFCFLMTHGRVLRGESVFKSELSDLCDLIKTNEGSHPCQILIMQIITGKTNGQKTLYGRVMRHRNVNMCPIGALGFYWMARFNSTCKLAQYDFNDNSSWFNVKVLAHSNNKGKYEKSITDNAYFSTMKSACKNLGITSKHFVHFGRGTGAVACEMQEVDLQYIKMIGNWNPDVREDRYSSKLPMKAMRALAGHSQSRGGFFLPRNSVDPPEELPCQVFPFVVEAINNLNTERSTAKAFLGLMKNSERVVLQDVAILMNNSRKHRLFSLPVFATDLFKSYQTAVIENVMIQESAGTPTTLEQSMEIAMPGVHDFLHNIQSEVYTVSYGVGWC